MINNMSMVHTSTDCIKGSESPDIVIYFLPAEEIPTSHCQQLSYKDLISDILQYNKVCRKPDPNFVDSNGSGEKTHRKVYCTPRKLIDNTTAQVQIINSTVLQEKLNSTKDENEHYCAVVMFYAPWCHFCARTAPHYNALARAFPQMDIFAIDAVIHSS